MKLVKGSARPRPHSRDRSKDFPVPKQLDNRFFSPDGNPIGTCKIVTDAFEEMGFFFGDILVVEREAEPESGDIIVQESGERLGLAWYRPSLQLASVGGILRDYQTFPIETYIGRVRFIIRRLREV